MAIAALEIGLFYGIFEKYKQSPRAGTWCDRFLLYLGSHSQNSAHRMRRDSVELKEENELCGVKFSKFLKKNPKKQRIDQRFHVILTIIFFLDLTFSIGLIVK